MKALIVRGNPRKNGVCERLADLFAEGMKSGGAEILDVSIADSNIEMCRGCFSCTKGKKGKCIINDDMQKILDFLSEADALVCVSPVYFYTMSAQMKMFFDRCFPFIRGYVYDEQKKCAVNVVNFKNKKKKFATISVASGRLGGSFEALSKTYKTIADAFGLEYCADIKRSESPYFGVLGMRTIRIRRILEAYKTAGKSFAQNGKIDKKTLDAAQMQLTESDEIFAAHAKIFWELSAVRSVGDYTSEAAQTDVRILLREMCKLFSPKFAPKKASIKFDFTDRNWKFKIAINDGHCELEQLSENDEQTADLTIKTETPVWCDIMAKRRDIVSLVETGKMKIYGDKSLFVAMKRIFDFSQKR